MNFDFDPDMRPDPLVVTQGEQSFRLIHRYIPSAVERTRIVEAMALDPALAIELLMGLVTGWEGVRNKSGADQPFKFVGKDGAETRYLDAVMAQVDYDEQLRTAFRQLAMNGVRLAGMERALATFMEPNAVANFAREIDGFLSERSRRRTSASTESPTTGT